MIRVCGITWSNCLKCKHYDSNIECTKNVQDSDLVIEWEVVYCMLGEEIEDESKKPMISKNTEEDLEIAHDNLTEELRDLRIQLAQERQDHRAHIELLQRTAAQQIQKALENNMSLKDITFSVHDYDRDGDIANVGIFLHFGETRIKVANTLEEFVKVVARINDMVIEIRENYPTEE